MLSRIRFVSAVCAFAVFAVAWSYAYGGQSERTDVSQDQGPAAAHLDHAHEGHDDLDIEAIERITGLEGASHPDEVGGPVFKVTQPRTDVEIRVEGRPMEPFMGFTSWAAFQPGVETEAMVMGDLVVFEDEVSPVMDALFEHGCEVTALHNHFFYAEPRVYFMHIGGEGTTEQLAKGIRAAFETVGRVRRAQPDPLESDGFGGPPIPGDNAITAARLDEVLFPDGGSGNASNGLYKAVFGRTVRMSCGCPAGSQMGINTWAAFCGTDQAAGVAGDFVTFEGELQPVLRALRSHGVHVVAIHNHMEGEQPRAIFLHYWGKGPAADLARGVRAALDAQIQNTHEP